MVNPYVFIVGCARSGTTLLRRLVKAHPLVAITPEAQWIARYYEQGDGLTAEGFVTRELVSRIADDPKLSGFKIRTEKLFKLLKTDRPTSYADFITHLFDLYGERKEKALVGNKTPSIVRRLHSFHSLWPEARFVHLIRDGRDVCLSMVEWPKVAQVKPGVFSTWRTDTVSTTALWWDSNVRLGRQAGHSLGPKLYYEIRYESLVRNPEPECAALCEFLDVPYDAAMLRFHEGRTKYDPGLSVKKAWKPITPGLRDWRTQMAAGDVERFEAVAGDQLDELGYSRAYLHPRPEALQHAATIRELLGRDPQWNQVVPRTQAGTVSSVGDPRMKTLVAAGSAEGSSQA